MLFCKKKKEKKGRRRRTGFEVQAHFSQVQGCNFIGCDI